MNNSAETVANFYHQLALLTKANIPLPESISKLGNEIDNSPFKNAIQEILEKLNNGSPLSSALKSRPDFFDDFQIKLLETGEQTGNLSEILFELAKFSQYNLQITNKFKEITLYPLFCINIAAIILFSLMVTVIPSFPPLYTAILDGKQLPQTTQMIFSFSQFCLNYTSICVMLFLIINFILAFLYLGGIKYQRILNRIMYFIPFTNKIIAPLDSARFCILWSLLLKQKLSTSSAFFISSKFIKSPSLAKSLMKAGEKSQSGASFIDCIKETKLDTLIKWTAEHSLEEKLPDEIYQLSELFSYRIQSQMKMSLIIWQLSTYVFLCLVAFISIYALFSPLTTLINLLSR